jgi:tetratricopeptide (TPR) repeat protein
LRSAHPSTRRRRLQKNDLSAQSARINELSRAGKYSEALPLAIAMVASLEKSNNSRDLAGALNNLAQIHAAQGHDDQAEPLYKRAIALLEKSFGLDTPEIAPELNNLAGASIPMSASPSRISPRSM